MALNFYITSFSGIASSTGSNLIAVDSVNLGGEDPNGILTPSDVILGCGAGRYSPLLLQAMVEQTTHKVILKGFKPDAQGVERNFLTITLTGATVAGYHLGGAADGFTDTLHLAFVTLDYDWVQNGVEYIWQPA